jgi:hypothetical protein
MNCFQTGEKAMNLFNEKMGAQNKSFGGDDYLDAHELIDDEEIELDVNGFPITSMNKCPYHMFCISERDFL